MSKNIKDNLGARMKEYENSYSSRAMNYLPLLARIDGKTFHNWTKGLEKPFDRTFINIMQAVANYLVIETNAVIGYTQSDEISLCWNQNELNSQFFMGGKFNKLNSILASMTTALFNDLASNLLKGRKLAFFDCRTWQVPNQIEAANYFVWRENDAARNSISMLAQSHFSHKQLHKKSQRDMHEMLHEKGVNWNNLEDELKRGTYIRRNGLYYYWWLRKSTNKVDVIFNNEDPIEEK